MAANDLYLPVNIPWKLLATSHDMMDRTLGGGSAPLWRSSLAMFTYEPEYKPADHGDQRVSYVKLVCSITGFQSDRIRPKTVDFGPLPPRLVNELQKQLNRYYACYGVLLQVSVHPVEAADRSDISRYPIIVGMEPKQRDLYEIVTETGQALNSSSNRVSVDKGLSSSFSASSGWNLSGTASSSPGGGGGGAGGSVTGGVSGSSTTGMNDQTSTDVDYSREKQESESHVTTLTQMYNLLQSYHIGTNRAVVLLQPRPHLTEQVEKRTFINGPREIEGIQEFLFIVSRPADVEHICVEALLETGHLDLDPANAEELTSKTDPFTFNFPAPDKIEHGESAGDDSTSQTFNYSSTYSPPDGWEVDIDKGSGGYTTLPTEGSAAYSVQTNAESVVVSATVRTEYYDTVFDDYYNHQGVKGALLIYRKKKAALTTGEVRSTFFTTARKVVGCTHGPAGVQASEWISFEAPLRADPRMSAPTSTAGTRMRLANELGRQIGTVLLESLRARPRYSSQSVRFEHSNFVLDRMAAAARRPSLERSAGPKMSWDLSESIVGKQQFKKLSPVLGKTAQVADLIDLPTARLAEMTEDETLESALALKWRALGFGPKQAPAAA